jgi:hypothetical protein
MHNPCGAWIALSVYQVGCGLDYQKIVVQFPAGLRAFFLFPIRPHQPYTVNTGALSSAVKQDTDRLPPSSAKLQNL